MGINRYSTPVQNTLQEYVPIPLEAIAQAGQMIQQRGDAAQLASDQTQFGLASTEALAPAYKQFVNEYANDYKSKASELLAKYNNNTSNPEFIRESKRLTTQFATDPRLQIIRQGNEQIKANEAIANKLQAEGKLFIKPQFTGKNQLGQLTADVANVEGVNVLDDWAKAGSIAHQSIEDLGGGNQSNIRNLNRWKKAIQSDALGQTKLMQAYMSQGYSPEQAQQAVQTQIQGLVNQYGIRSEHRDSFDQLQLARAKAAQEAQPTIPNLIPFEKETTQVINDNFRQPVLDKIDRTINRLNQAGGISKTRFTVPDTEENRKLYGNKIVDKLTRNPYAIAKANAPANRELVVEGTYNQEELSMVRQARTMLGSLAKNESGKFLSDKTVLSRYKEILANDNTIYSFTKPNNTDYVKALTDIKVGSNGQNIGPEYTLFTADGKSKSNDAKGENPLKGLKGFEFAGVNPTAFGKYSNGTIKINAVDENNNPVSILKPLNSQEKQMFALPNSLYKLMNSELSNEELSKKPIQTSQGNIIVQKGVTSDNKMGMKAYLQTASGLQEVNVDGLIEGIMSKYYNTQQPYQNLK